MNCRCDAKNQLDEYKKQNDEQSSEIADLNHQLIVSQQILNEKDQSLISLRQLLAVRTDFIASMQLKEEQLTNQLNFANRLVNEKSEDWHKMLTSLLSNDEQMLKHQEQMDAIKTDLQESQEALELSEARAAKLAVLNGQLKLQFHKIMSYRDLTVTNQSKS